VRRNVWYLTCSVVLIVGGFLYTLASGNTPILGLDLRGGFSVVLSPVGKFKSESIDVARDIIETRVNGLGVAEPQISRQGNDIVVDLPGVKDRRKAERIVGRTAELQFRPVLLAGLPPESQASTTPSTTAPAGQEPTATTTPADAAAAAAVASCDASQLASLPDIPTSPPDAKRTECVVFPDKTGGKNAIRYYLGPSALTGKAVDNAKAEFLSGQGWTVKMSLTDSGSGAWDQLGEQQFHKQVAIVLDGQVQSAPTIQPDNQAFSSFGGTAVISGGSQGFSQTDASDLAKLINYGALPVHLVQQTSQSVSPTLGSDQLNAGIAAGIIGLTLVAIYMLVYYRLLGLVVILGLMLSGMAIYALVTYLGQAISLTLTLAGVTGIIVSVGVTVDSYVVYFERLKDEVRAGATVRSSADRAFHRSFRTIVAADLVSLLGAVVLYLVAIGSVRGFAFYLGLSTILDLLIAYFFMHPLVSILSRHPRLVRMPGIGIGTGLDAREAIA
jgi:preprotein translocase subunit SecD